MEALATVPTPHGDCHCARFFPSAEFASAAFPERDREGERESERERVRGRERRRDDARSAFPNDLLGVLRLHRSKADGIAEWARPACWFCATVSGLRGR